ncbi:hypothetical protein L218DRAFT_949492 [Marasmius fiardii PR-910]|nr:hypothetical protein L218DRAFT_949492 [Marasmius fiardii PR-910]
MAYSGGSSQDYDRLVKQEVILGGNTARISTDRLGITNPSDEFDMIAMNEAIGAAPHFIGMAWGSYIFKTMISSAARLTCVFLQKENWSLLQGNTYYTTTDSSMDKGVSLDM